MRENRPNFYSILGVEDYASDDTIRNAYRTLAKKFHPDTCQISDKRQAEEQFKLINEAYDVLSDPNKKKDFDEYLYNKQIHSIDPNKIRSTNSAIYSENTHVSGNYTSTNYTPDSYSANSYTTNAGYGFNTSEHDKKGFQKLNYDDAIHYYSEPKTSFKYNVDSNLAERFSIIVKFAAAALFLVVLIFIGLTFDKKSKNISQKQSDISDIVEANEDKNPEQEDPLKNFVTIGKSKQQVKTILGEPSGVRENFWKYGSSKIFFDTNNQVKGWDNTGRNLKVFVYKKEDGAPPIRLGSTKLDVKKAMGTPSFLYLNLWKYGSSEIYFNEDGKVKKIVNRDGNLKVQF